MTPTQYETMVATGVAPCGCAREMLGVDSVGEETWSVGHTCNPNRTEESAAANATNNDLQERAALKVVSVVANEGPEIRRFRAKARGRAGAFNRPTSHITVVVEGQGA